MTPQQLSAICESFDKARKIDPEFGTRFYNHLSNDYPETSDVFETVSMRAQHTRFVGMLDIILLRMSDGRSVTPLLKELGAQHGGFGVREEHFRMFGATLIKVLHELLGYEFNDYLREAWLAVYDEISIVMKSAAKTPSA